MKSFSHNKPRRQIMAGASVALLLALVALSLWLTTGDKPQVELLKFPYPYRAALALCSDIDGAESMDEFYATQDFLCGNSETQYGSGLGLETGNSFWFYNQYMQLLSQGDKDTVSIDSMFSGTPDRGVSVFRGTSDTLSDYAEDIFELIRAGYIDCLHSYGHFAEDGFRRRLAQRALPLFDSLELKVRVFVSHGGPENQNNLGLLETFRGDNPAAAEYHADLTDSLGVRFIWRGQMTHCVGQNGEFSFRNLLRMSVEWAQDLLNPKQDFHHDNELVHELVLDDGRRVFEFVRFINPWGKYSSATEEYISKQLSEDVVDELIENEGYLVFYTHFSSNEDDEPTLHKSTIRSLRYIKNQSDARELFVTTTSRLLRYYVTRKYLKWSTQVTNDSIIITLDSLENPVEGKRLPSAEDLAGISFATSDAPPLTILLNGAEVASERFSDGERQITRIRWEPLKYPR